MRNYLSKIGGFFITFEGIDGCGKSTQARLLAENLNSLGVDTFWTKEPGGTEIGKMIREILLKFNGEIDTLTEFLLFASDRSAHVKEIIKELSKGKVVISERFKDSSIAYQGYGGGLSINFIERIHREISILEPDLTILLDIAPTTSLKRVKDPDRIEKKGIDYLDRVRNGYLILSKIYKNRYVIFDGEKEKDTLSKEIFEVVKERITEYSF
ncbi:MAG: dTMP kinase [Caldisericia bacterium]|jgi:dTMP kinase|nr:dTMP kinase [Caldisericia bacterium]